MSSAKLASAAVCKLLSLVSMATGLERPLDIDLWYDTARVNKLVPCPKLYSVYTFVICSCDYELRES